MLVNGWLAVSTIAPLVFITRLYSTHSGSSGITVSHLASVVPYGKSHKIISTLPSGIRFMPSRQSSLYIVFSIILLTPHIYHVYLFVLLTYEYICRPIYSL